jgi:hypothetical protein
MTTGIQIFGQSDMERPACFKYDNSASNYKLTLSNHTLAYTRLAERSITTRMMFPVTWRRRKPRYCLTEHLAAQPGTSSCPLGNGSSGGPMQEFLVYGFSGQTSVPEPSALTLFGSIPSSLGLINYRKKRRA